MDKSDLKQIGDLLDRKLDQKLEAKLKPINQKLDQHSKILVEHSRKLDALTLDVINLQKDTKLIKDIHENTKDIRKRVDNLEERVEVLETATKL